MDFLKTLPSDGSLVVLPLPMYGLAETLREQKLVHVTPGLWPDMMVSLTFEGLKAVCRSEG